VTINDVEVEQVVLII